MTISMSHEFIGEGYRQLQGGEFVLQTDEASVVSAASWYGVYDSVGKPVLNDGTRSPDGVKLVFRRKVRLCEDDPAKRYLDPGETPRDSDEMETWASSAKHVASWGPARRYLRNYAFAVGEPGYSEDKAAYLRRFRRLIDAQCTSSGLEAEVRWPARLTTLCGCKKHQVNVHGDLYTQHREWCQKRVPVGYPAPEGGLDSCHASQLAKGFELRPSKPVLTTLIDVQHPDFI